VSDLQILFIAVVMVAIAWGYLELCDRVR